MQQQDRYHKHRFEQKKKKKRKNTEPPKYIVGFYLDQV